MEREIGEHRTAGIELLRVLSAEGERIFSTSRARELGPAAGFSDAYVRQALHYLEQAGWIVRLKKGLYAMGSGVPGATPVHEYEIAMALVKPAAISHWSAMSYHSLTDQIPHTVFVLTTTEASLPRVAKTRPGRARGLRTIAETSYRFIRVKPERFFGTTRVWIAEGRVTVTDAERTLLDGLTMPQYCGDFAEVLHAFHVRGRDIDVARIVDYALRLDVATAKRLGWVLEREGVPAHELERLAALPVTSYRKLDPTGPLKGPRNRHWMVQENLPGGIAT